MSYFEIKIHLVCEANEISLRFLLSPGQASDITHAQPLLNQVRIPGKSGRPRCCRWLLADKDYDADHLLQCCGRYRMKPVIPQRTMKRSPKLGSTSTF